MFVCLVRCSTDSYYCFLDRCFQGIFQEFRDTNAKYKQRVRSRVSNLRDAKNPLLKVKVLSGQITPEKFASMPTEVPKLVITSCSISE